MPANHPPDSHRIYGDACTRTDQAEKQRDHYGALSSFSREHHEQLRIAEAELTRARAAESVALAAVRRDSSRQLVDNESAPVAENIAAASER